MTTAFAQVPPDSTAAEALAMIRSQAEDVETVYYIYVVDRSEHLLGVFSLRDLLAVPDSRRVRDFMTADPVTVKTPASEEEVTAAIAKYNLLALPVVDDEGVLHGIVTVDDAIDLVLPLAWKKRLPRSSTRRWRPPLRSRPGAPGRIGRSRLLVFLAVMGPGLITANSDNDAGGITTWSVAGARYAMACSGCCCSSLRSWRSPRRWGRAWGPSPARVWRPSSASASACV